MSPNWFTEFISYSSSQDELYCAACVSFHAENKRKKPYLLLSMSYRNWKDAKYDLTKHSLTEAHLMSKAKMDAFMHIYGKPAIGISCIISTAEKEVI